MPTRDFRPLVSRHNIALDVANARLEVLVGAPTLYVVQVDFPATIRLGSPDSPAIPLLSGEYRSPEGGIIEAVYIDNDAGPAGALAVLLPVDNLSITPQGSISNAGATRVETSPARGILTDHSGVSILGRTALCAINLVRRYFVFQNLGPGDLYLEFTSPTGAAAGSFLIKAGGAFVLEGAFVSTEAISVFDAVGGTPYTCKEA